MNTRDLMAIQEDLKKGEFLTHLVDMKDIPTLAHIQACGDVWVSWHREKREYIGTIEAFETQSTLDPRAQFRVEFVRVRLPNGERIHVNPASLRVLRRDLGWRKIV